MSFKHKHCFFLTFWRDSSLLPLPLAGFIKNGISPNAAIFHWDKCLLSSKGWVSPSSWQNPEDPCGHPSSPLPRGLWATPALCHCRHYCSGVTGRNSLCGLLTSTLRMCRMDWEEASSNFYFTGSQVFFKSEAKEFSVGRPGPHLCQGRDTMKLPFPSGPHVSQWVSPPCHALSLLSSSWKPVGWALLLCAVSSVRLGMKAGKAECSCLWRARWGLFLWSCRWLFPAGSGCCLRSCETGATLFPTSLWPLDDPQVEHDCLPIKKPGPKPESSFPL